MLKCEHVSVAYGAHNALQDVSIHIAPGEICVILGANGAGKTTLLKTIAGLVTAAAPSHIEIDGQTLTNLKSHKIVEAGVALVPEGRGIFGDLSVADNLALGAYGHQARHDKDQRLEQVLELFPKLAERAGQTARTMSGGEQQMVAIGRALMSAPTILMLDEPSLGLSPILSSSLFKSLRVVRDAGVGILLVEQNAKQSLAIADRAYLLENGQITGEGRAADLLHDKAVQEAFLGKSSAQQNHKRFGVRTPIRVLAPMAKRAENASELATRAATISAIHHGVLLPAALVPSTIPPSSPSDSEASGTERSPKIKTEQSSAIGAIDIGSLVARASAISTAHIATQRQTVRLTTKAAKTEQAKTGKPKSGKSKKHHKKNHKKHAK